MNFFYRARMSTYSLSTILQGYFGKTFQTVKAHSDAELLWLLCFWLLCSFCMLVPARSCATSPLVSFIVAAAVTRRASMILMLAGNAEIIKSTLSLSDDFFLWHFCLLCACCCSVFLGVLHSCVSLCFHEVLILVILITPTMKSSRAAMWHNPADVHWLQLKLAKMLQLNMETGDRHNCLWFLGNLVQVLNYTLSAWSFLSPIKIKR